MQFEQLALILSGLGFLFLGVYFQDEKRIKEMLLKENNRRGQKTDTKNLKEAVNYWKKVYIFWIGFGIILIILTLLFPRIF